MAWKLPKILGKNLTSFMLDDNSILHQPLFWINRWVRISWPVGMYITKINYMHAYYSKCICHVQKKALFRCWPFEHMLLKYCKNSQINDAQLFWNNVLYSYLDSLKSKFLILNSLDFSKVQCLLTFNIVLVNGIMYT